MSKPKTMINKEVDAMHIVGDEFAFFDSSKLQRKQIFDKNIMTNMNI